MNATNIKNILEAALMVSTQPLTLDKLQGLFARDAVQPDRDVLRSALAELAEDCSGRGIELKEVASGWRYQVRADYADWVNRLWDEKPPRYSRALMETLAIIAYRQPITRGEIEDIRGVSVSANIVRTLQEREWIKSVGHRDVPGKPELLATTKEFLDYFNLKKLSDLPTLAEIRDLDEINPDLFTGLEQGEGQATAETGTGQSPAGDDDSGAVDIGTEGSVADDAEADVNEDETVAEFEPEAADVAEGSDERAAGDDSEVAETGGAAGNSGGETAATEDEAEDVASSETGEAEAVDADVADQADDSAAADGADNAMTSDAEDEDDEDDDSDKVVQFSK